jgi:Zn-dependent peptidase ImmA (M78 family)
MTQQEVHEKAAKVDNISYDYHLTHAVFACDKMLEDAFKEQGKKETVRITNELKIAYKNKDNHKAALLLKQKKALKLTKYHIFVDYIKGMARDAGRVIKVEDKLVISLPDQLAIDAKAKDGLFNKSHVNKLREVMAHELGHIALHVDKLVSNNLQGSNDIKGQEETEADWFAKELLCLRVERNKKLNSA